MPSCLSRNLVIGLCLSLAYAKNQELDVRPDGDFEGDFADEDALMPSKRSDFPEGHAHGGAAMGRMARMMRSVTEIHQKVHVAVKEDNGRTHEGDVHAKGTAHRANDAGASEVDMGLEERDAEIVRTIIEDTILIPTEIPGVIGVAKQVHVHDEIILEDKHPEGPTMSQGEIEEANAEAHEEYLDRFHEELVPTPRVKRSLMDRMLNGPAENAKVALIQDHHPVAEVKAVEAPASSGETGSGRLALAESPKRNEL